MSPVRIHMIQFLLKLKLRNARSLIGSGRTCDGLLKVRSDFRSPTGPDGTSGGVRRTSDTILGLILTILGLKAFI